MRKCRLTKWGTRDRKSYRWSITFTDSDTLNSSFVAPHSNGTYKVSVKISESVLVHWVLEAYHFECHSDNSCIFSCKTHSYKTIHRLRMPIYMDSLFCIRQYCEQVAVFQVFLSTTLPLHWSLCISSPNHPTLCRQLLSCFL